MSAKYESIAEVCRLLDERRVGYTDIGGAIEVACGRGAVCRFYPTGAKLMVDVAVILARPEEAVDIVLGQGKCHFTLEYDREEVEIRRKAYEKEPFGLFPQSMPQVAWTCSHCGKQYAVHYEDNTSNDPRVARPVPIPMTRWVRFCPSCGWEVVE